MEITPMLPDWLTWAAACGAGLIALGLLARGLEAVLDLDIG